MTPIEARGKAKSFLKWYYKNVDNIRALAHDTYIISAAEELRLTLEALYNISDKEEPIKPREQKILGIRHNCPKCDYTITSHARYCSNCGQRIDWERDY